MPVERKHREEVARIVWPLAFENDIEAMSKRVRAAVHRWIATGEEGLIYDVDFTSVEALAQALAQRDARIGGLIESAQQSGREYVRERANLQATIDGLITTLSEAEKRLAVAPGTVAVELGDSTTIRQLAALSYIDDEGEVCRPLTPTRFQGLDLDTEYTMTLLLKPAGG